MEMSIEQLMVMMLYAGFMGSCLVLFFDGHNYCSMGIIDEYHLIIFNVYEYLWFLNIYGICMRHGNIYGMYTRRSTELGNINGVWEYIQYNII